jgi:hypothetical protein
MRHVLPILLIAALGGCSVRDKGDIIDVHDTPSPDGRYIVTVFGETFYNTTGYDRHVHLRRAGQKRGYPGNVFVVGPGDAVAVAWSSPTNLSVRYRFEWPRSGPGTTNIDGVAITFSEIPLSEL